MKELILNKIYSSPIIALFIFIVGILCGRMIASKPSEIITKTDAVQKSAQIAKITTQANDEKDSNKEKIEFSEHKTYSNKGKLKSVDFQELKYINRSKNDISRTQLAFSDIQNTSTTITETKTIYQPNWMFGLSLPTETIRDYKQFNMKQLDFHIDYRIFTRLHVFGSSNYKITDARVGFMTGF
jgi:hypothetical protein